MAPVTEIEIWLQSLLIMLIICRQVSPQLLSAGFKRTERTTMIVRQTSNSGIFRYLERNSGIGDLPDVRPPREQQRDYWECGAHPEIVERLWDQLGKLLPAECRQVVLGSPALVHPDSGVVLAIAIGTQYGLRLPTLAWRDGLPAGARTLTVWAGGDQMDIQEEFGRDWVFGTWSAAEDTWCLQTFRERGAG